MQYKEQLYGRKFRQLSRNSVDFRQDFCYILPISSWHHSTVQHNRGITASSHALQGTLCPAAAGAYTIKAQIYYYIEFYQLVNGIQRTTKTRQNQVTSTITVNAVKEYSPTAAASDVRILQSKETTENSITISWNPCSVPDVQIIYSEDQNNMPVFPTDSWVTPSNKEQPEFTINNLKADTDYYIQMRTVKMMYPFFVYGKPSAVLKAKTLPEAVSPAPTETVPDGTYTAGQFKYTVKNNKATVKAPVNKNATKLTIPATVKINSIKVKVIGIGNGAMSGMKKLTSLTIGSNVEKIGKKAAYNCPKLKTLTVKTKKLKAEKVGANAFGKSKKMTVKCPAGMKNVYKKILVKKGVRKDCTFK